jgi:tripartite-type tricarboxylate transporter receptor subunit TctC
MKVSLKKLSYLSGIIMAMKKLFSLAVLVCMAFFANAQTGSASGAYPNRTVTIVCGFPAGGPTDIAARILAKYMSEATGQSFVVENRAGATGTVAAMQVKRAAPDGYTLFVSSIGTYVVAPHLLKGLAFDPRTDLDYISLAYLAPNVLVTGSTQAARTVAEVIALHKKNPGKMTFASSGNGASDHLAAELFWQQTGTTGLHIPYKGGAPAMSDMLGGQVDFFMTNINVLLPHIKSGKLFPIAITDSVRSPALPNVPTFTELGIQGVEISGWQALTSPKGLPAPVKQKLYEMTVAAMKDSATAKTLTEQGIKIVANTPEEFTAFQLKEYDRWKRLIESRGIKAD